MTSNLLALTLALVSTSGAWNRIVRRVALFLALAFVALVATGIALSLAGAWSA